MSKDGVHPSPAGNAIIARHIGEAVAPLVTNQTESDDQDIPRVLLIGDSISMGYTPHVQRQLAGKVDVQRIRGNGKYSAYGLKNLDDWIGSSKWDVIHFNWGLWDLCYRNPKSKAQGRRDKVDGTLTATPEEYRANLEKIVAKLKETDAKLIWCNTTPVPEHEVGRKVGDDIRYNQIAEEIMQANGILINDLHSYALLKQSEIQVKRGDVHFTQAGYAYLGDKVAREITTALNGAVEKKPNIIFMLTDDLGYSDVSCYGATKVKTPHIDRLASNGIKFSSFHTAASICSPSRAAFLTGAYPQRSGLYMGINPKRTAHWFLGLHPDEITIAEQLKTAGYKTHMVGKWHLGTEPEFLPRKQGFDSYYGMPSNFAHSPKFFDNDEEVFGKTPLNRLTELYTERITSIIERQADQEEPFFLYFAHNYPHTPFEAGKDFQGNSQDGVRGNVMQELDWGVGEMMAALEKAGIADNTIVVFTSDNGPTSNKYALPYRGTKYVTFEGGHRVPFILCLLYTSDAADE